MLDQLKNGEIEHFQISKEQFLSFQHVLVSREDFKHFRGVAQRGGSVIYYYLEEARS
ncbi:hypothetical protein [Bacillaceae bacterium SAOS 7]|uniref:hypothetical protein n=1 Tax=Bacillus sp. FJAT-42315 TaxID=2014077 RepID=UPI000BA9D0F3|nr:hypothetical protein CD798_10425 [Bacillaceae bacterium SAOS 7]